jgi:hypothetical protein
MDGGDTDDAGCPETTDGIILMVGGFGAAGIVGVPTSVRRLQIASVGKRFKIYRLKRKKPPMLAHRRLINPKKPNENSCKNGVFPEFVFMFEKIFFHSL